MFITNFRSSQFFVHYKQRECSLEVSSISVVLWLGGEFSVGSNFQAVRAEFPGTCLNVFSVRPQIGFLLQLIGNRRHSRWQIDFC